MPLFIKVFISNDIIDDELCFWTHEQWWQLLYQMILLILWFYKPNIVIVSDQPLVWYALFHQSIGQIILMKSKCLLNSFSVRSKTRQLFPQPVEPVNIVICQSFDIVLFYLSSLICSPAYRTKFCNLHQIHNRTNYTDIHGINHIITTLFVQSNIIWSRLSARCYFRYACSFKA